MAIPCKDGSQYRRLEAKKQGLKSDILTGLNQEDLARWVEERDFGAIKFEVLKVINKYSERPVEDIYFDSFMVQ